MKFPLEMADTTKNKEKLLEILKHGVCNNCLGRQFGMIGHGLTNAERGKTLRNFASKLTNSELKEPANCQLCKNFFKNKMNEIAEKIAEKLRDIEFKTFLIGTILSDEIAKKQEELWEEIGIEDVESIKSEINREVGKKIEELTKKNFNLKNPDITILVDLNDDRVRLQIRSLFLYGKYQKLVRGIPQTKWICSNCGGKGCIQCKGTGKLYKTSIQEIVEKPFLTATKGRESRFHGAGREDIDARNLDYRPFVIEIINPKKRKINLGKIGNQINKSKKVKVRGLKFVERNFVDRIKTERFDKTYLAEVKFEKTINKEKLKELKKLENSIIMQKTPTRVIHRRADILRKRGVKKISWKLTGKKKLEIKIRAEAGLYIKELISGDEGRTEPNIAALLNNKVKKISLDVIKIHTK